MKKILLILLSLALLPLSALCEKVTVNLEKEGTLETVISEQTASDITELKIIGLITASDIKFLRKCEGKIANLESLDLSDVTLVSSDEPYAGDPLRGLYYLTDEEKSWDTSPGGMYMVTYYHYGSMNLSKAFEGMLLETVVLPATMKKIGTCCFKDCKLLTNVVLPEGITVIDDEAFQGAISLKTINIGNTKEIGDRAFSGCTSLTGIDLSKVETIGEEVFNGCTSLSSVNIPKLTEVTGSAFAGCTGLKEITFSTNMKTIGKSAFSGCTGIETLSLPEGLESIGQNAFEKCTFANVTLPNSIKIIDSESFAGCGNLESIVLPNGLETIGNRAFRGCDLISITFPGSLKYIGSEVFYSNDLASVTFAKGGGGLKIGEKAFYHLWSLKSVVFEEGVESIGEYAFYGCGLETIVLPEGLKSIGGYAFYSCSNLSSVTLPNTLEYIGACAFFYTEWAESKVADDDGILYYGNVAMKCTDKSESGVAIKFKDGTLGVADNFGSGTTITSVEFPSSMRHIGSYAFSGQGITSLVLNDGLEVIEGDAFANCNSLTNVVIPESVKRMIYPFTGCDGIVLMTINAKNLSEDSRLRVVNLTKLTIGSEVQVLPDNFVDASNSLRVIFEDRSPESSLYIGTKSLPYSYMTSLRLPNCRIALGKEALKNVKFQFEIPGIITEIGESALASSGVSGSIRLSEDVTSICEGAFSGCSGLTSVTIPNTLTSIGDGAFYGCSSLNSIIIPDGVISIGNYAFEDCSGLTSVNIPDGVTSIGDYVFAHCTGLASVNIPNGVTYIGWQTFNNCALTSITIPNSVTTINSMAFVNCTALTSVTIGNGVTSIGGSAFDGCTSLTEVNISDMVAWCNIDFEESSSNPLQYAHHLYLNGEEIKEMVIPDGVTSIDNHAFYNCSGLTSVIIPDGVTSIGKEAFRGCSGLTSLSIPNSVNSIGDYTFANCSGLTNIISYIMEPMELLSGTFYGVLATATLYVPVGTRQLYLNTNGWDKFTRVREGDGTMPENAIAFADINVNDVCVKEWDTDGDGYLSYDEAAAVEAMNEEFKGSTIISFEELKFFVNLKIIGDNAFYNCGRLASISIPNGVTSIGEKAFSGCRGLTSVTIPDGMTSIGEEAFYGCSSLTSVTIPASVTSIANYAFYGCSGLTSVTSYIKEPFEIDYYTFGNSYNKATLYVPAGTSGKYKNVYYWKLFYNIEEMVSTILGDTDGDGEVTLEDVELVKEYIMTGKTEGLIFTNADTNGNKQLNVVDIVKMINIIKNKKSTGGMGD